MTALDELRRAAEALPEGAALTLPKAMLLEVLATVTATTTHTVATLAALLRRSPSTVRTWLEGGQFPGAYQLPGAKRHGAWRIPHAAVEAFASRQRRALTPPAKDLAATDSGRDRPHRRPSLGDVHLGAWRGVRGKGGAR